MDGLNSLGEGFWDNLTKALPAFGLATAQVVNAATGNTSQAQLAAAQQAAAVAAANQANASSTSRYLLIGGVAVGALALLMYMRKR